MHRIDVVKQIALGTILSLLMVVGIHFLFTDMLHYKGMFLSSLVFFIVLTYIIHVIATRALQNKQKDFFIYIVMMNVLIKIVFAFGFVMVYVKMFPPENKWFIIPFLINYLIFTVIETIILTKMAKPQ